MSKLYERYLSLKASDNTKLYLFRCGKFYIFLGEDADYINQYVVLKKTKFTNEVCKCGFPVNSLEDYLKVFQNHQLQIELVENEPVKDPTAIIEKLEKLDINRISPLDAFLFLKELKEQLK